MHLINLTAFVVAAATVGSTGLIYNPETGVFNCAESGAAYCAGDSLQTNIIILCTGDTGIPADCNGNLAGIPPVGVKRFAPCYQSSPTAGDAGCSFDGIVYSQKGTFPLPGPNTTNPTATAVRSLLVVNPSGTAAAPFPTSATSNWKITDATTSADTVARPVVLSAPFVGTANEAVVVGWGAFLSVLALVCFL